jgi:hypothetical protein
MARKHDGSRRHLRPLPGEDQSGHQQEPRHRAADKLLRLVHSAEELAIDEHLTIESVKQPETRPDILDIITVLNERCKDTIHEDENLFKLEQAFLLLAQAAAIDEPPDKILSRDSLLPAAKTQEAILDSARLYDGLDALKQAFEYARTDSHTGKRNQQNLIKFMSQALPSSAWRDGVARDLILIGIDEAYMLCRDAYHRHANSIDDYLTKLQNELLKNMELKDPGADATEFEKRKFEMARLKLISEAWDDWNISRVNRLAPKDKK